MSIMNDMDRIMSMTKAGCAIDIVYWNSYAVSKEYSVYCLNIIYIVDWFLV